MHRLSSYIVGCLVFFAFAMLGAGQNYASSDEGIPGRIYSASSLPQPIATLPVRPMMPPDLALSIYLHRANEQLLTLGSYSDIEVVQAELPETSQHGRLKLRRMFAAPKTLTFQALDFAGDNFIKSNVIARLLQSEVDHVQKGEGPKVAITDTNYKFSYKGMQDSNGRMLYVYAVKPHKKRPGLFKGRIYVDPADGALTRAEGTLVKSPSMFIKRVHFVQDYSQVAGFSLPVHIHTVAETRVVGRAIVDIVESDYEAHPLGDRQTASVAQ